MRTSFTILFLFVQTFVLFMACRIKRFNLLIERITWTKRCEQN